MLSTKRCFLFNFCFLQASERAELHPLGEVSTSIAGAQGLQAQADETNFDKLSESLRALSSGLASS